MRSSPASPTSLARGRLCLILILIWTRLVIRGRRFVRVRSAVVLRLRHGLDIEGNNITLTHSNVYVDPSISDDESWGWDGVGWSNQTSGDVISNNRIHDVGFCPVEEHGIYLNKTAGVQVYGNWIYDIPAGTGIQVWDGPTNAHIYGNVINNTSSCVDVGGNSPVTTGNLIEHNICSNMHGVQQPYASYCNSPGPGCTGPATGAPLFDEWGTGTAGGGNRLQNNLLYCANASTCTTSLADSSGVSLAGNTSANPQFADSNYQTSHDYRVAGSSPPHPGDSGTETWEAQPRARSRWPAPPRSPGRKLHRCPGD